MNQAIIEDNTCFVPVGRPVGRPKNTNGICKVCGIELNFENARETRKGSRSLRSKCLSCEKAEAQSKYIKKGRKRVSRGPIFAERPNLIGMAVQRVKGVRLFSKIASDAICDKCGKNLIGFKHLKDITIFQDALCDECGGIIRYDEHIDRVCEKCGLMGDQVIYGFLDMEYAGRKVKSYEITRYDIDFHVNRDAEIDRQHSGNGNTVFNSYEPSPVARAFSLEYSKYYEKSLDVGKVPDYYDRIKKIKGRYRYG
jgi:hypothetical protein